MCKMQGLKFTGVGVAVLLIITCVVLQLHGKCRNVTGYLWVLV